MERIDQIQGTFDKREQQTTPVVSIAVIKRLPRYHRYLGELLRVGRLRISSAELSRMMNVTASQIRQDLNCFGGFGQQGYGYNVKYLHSKISELLGTTEGYRAVIVGAGNLGRALAATHMFERRGVERIAMFDNDPAVVGTTVHSLPVYHVDTLTSYCREMKVSLAVLTVPKESACEVVDMLLAGGVTGIWNFANMELDEDYGNAVVENIHLGDSLMKLTYEMKSKSRGKSNDASE